MAAILGDGERIGHLEVPAAAAVYDTAAGASHSSPGLGRGGGDDGGRQKSLLMQAAGSVLAEEEIGEEGI